ncbi:MAG: hypothetical protein IJP96_06255 [Synergistaceae bacterium]|nr:hypothetical protein [Synergistaceae bacterium]
MKKLIFTLILAISFSSLAGAAEKPKVVIYTSMYEDVIEAMTQVLHEKLPNYEVEFF